MDNVFCRQIATGGDNCVTCFTTPLPVNYFNAFFKYLLATRAVDGTVYPGATIRLLLAAFTMASTANLVISPCWSFIL
jgi:hypothetical protein